MAGKLRRFGAAFKAKVALAARLHDAGVPVSLTSGVQIGPDHW